MTDSQDASSVARQLADLTRTVQEMESALDKEGCEGSAEPLYLTKT